MAGLINLRLLTDFFNKINPKRTEADKLDIIAVSRGVCPLTGRAIHHLYSRGPVPRTYLAAHLRPLATTP